MTEEWMASPRSFTSLFTDHLHLPGGPLVVRGSQFADRCLTASFDISHRDMKSSRDGCPSPIGSEVSFRQEERKQWEIEVKQLVSSKQWLCQYGLCNNNLDLDHVLPSLGFKLHDTYNSTLCRPVSSKYGTGLFTQIINHNGYTYNITSSKSKVKQIEKRLLAAIFLYRRRLDWLTCESRRTFGVIVERSVVIVVDIKNVTPQQFHQCQSVLGRVLEEQVANVNQYNLIRAAEDMCMYKPSCVAVSHDSIEEGIAWLWQLDRTASVSRSATCEAVIKALEDRSVEAVYLFTEGCSVDGSIEILREKLQRAARQLPVHVVSYNCTDDGTIQTLKDLAQVTQSTFHAYAVMMELDTYECDTDSMSSQSTMRLKKKSLGGVPSGAGVREDALLIFNEIEEARNVLSEIQNLLQDISQPSIEQPLPVDRPAISKSDSEEQYMSSESWLKKFGLQANRLSLTDNLCAVAFAHKDGVIDIGSSDSHGMRQSKLVNARYCEQFPIIRWKDGRVMHVQVTPEIHRKYEERMMVNLNKIQQRMNWLRQGSRELFGTVLENKIYILVDTSSSMIPHIQFVKDKLFILMQEQLRHKMKFNLVSYNSRADPWCERLMDMNEDNLQMAWAWVQNLTCQGSTNTYGALQVALQDSETEAIYLLTDGRPDQPPKTVIAQVQMRRCIPIHTISFNCNDLDANEFLCELASVSGGRYHYYNDSSTDLELPYAWQSEDIRLLKDEYMQGMKNIEKMTELRDECAAMCWRKDLDDTHLCSRKHVISPDDQVTSSSPLPPKDLYRPQPRPKSAPSHPVTFSSLPLDRPSSSQSHSYMHHSPRSSRPKSLRPCTRPLTAGHTRTSLLRLLNSSGSFSSDSWLLPETQDLFTKQQQRHQEIVLKDQQRIRVTNKKCNKYTKMNGLNSRHWLDKYGLVAKRLTILDALAPTIVSHKAKYVPILNKHILAKVFDDVLPLAHVSSRNKKEIKLVNPNAVNLIEYEERLQIAVDMYKKRLNVIVWKALSEEEKSRFSSTHQPVSFEENKEELTDILKQSSWPLPKVDIALMEREIQRGTNFLQISQDLRKAACKTDTKITTKNRAVKDISDSMTSLLSKDLISDNGSVVLSNLTDESRPVSMA